ncbi:MAG: PEGA domain-containing protein [bacterium]
MRTAITVLAFIMLTLTFACTSDNEETPSATQYGDLVGHIYQAGTAEPVSAASISCGGNICYSTADGSYSLTGISTGTYELTVTKEGYNDYTATVSISTGTTTRDVQLVAVSLVGSIDGFVWEAETSNTLVGAVVACAGQTDTADQFGAYYLEEVPTGTQTISASLAGYEAYSATITVPPERLIYDIEMIPLIAYTTVTGNVTNAVDGEIEGALVEIDSVSGYCSAVGSYTLEYVRQGLTSLSCSHEEYDSYVSEITLDSPEMTFDIVMTKTEQETLFVTKDTYATNFPMQENSTNHESEHLYCNWGPFVGEAYIGLPPLSPTLEIENVVSAELHLWIIDAEPMIFSACVNFRRVVSPWSENTLTYNNRPEGDSTQYASKCFDANDEESWTTVDVLLFYQHWPSELSSGFRLSTGTGTVTMASSNNVNPAVRPFVLVETKY